MDTVTNKLRPTRLGFAVGATGVLFYLGCMLTMATVPRSQVIVFFNSLLHGFDIAPILRESGPPIEVILGIVGTFVLGWIAGAVVALCYNIGSMTTSAKE